MKSESIALAIAGVIFGLIAGWIIGSQQSAGRPPTPAAQSPAASAQSSTPAPALLDENKITAYKSVAEREPANAKPRVELGNMYFDAERYEDAVKWYGEAVKLQPDDANLSTDLGVSYYYINQPDRALEQFNRSLKSDPKHLKTFLNIGIVKAFGKKDLEGAQAAWQQIIQLAPDSPEGQAARRALDSVKAAHPGGFRLEARCVMVRLILILLLIVFIARAFWRVIDGVLDGMRKGAPPRARASRAGIQMARDPVCGTFVIPERAVTLDAGARQIHFCSTECRDAFRARRA